MIELSSEQEEFLKECEEEFKDRWTDKDEDFMKTKLAEPEKPPIVDPWYNAPQRSNSWNNEGRNRRNRNQGQGREEGRGRDDYRGRDYGRGRDDYRGRDSGRGRDYGRDRDRGWDRDRGRDRDRERDNYRERDYDRERDDQHAGKHHFYQRNNRPY